MKEIKEVARKGYKTKPVEKNTQNKPEEDGNKSEEKLA
jgi:hypothetical protein